VQASDVIQSLALSRHPEGGWFRETWRAAPPPGDKRAAATAILFLLDSTQPSHWHRVDATELWIFQGGAPLLVRTAKGDRGEAGLRTTRLGLDSVAGERPQHRVEPFEWQAAETTGVWSLVTCVVVPGFEYAGFELALQDWAPVAKPG
jgi:uncharacterized protein